MRLFLWFSNTVHDFLNWDSSFLSWIILCREEMDLLCHFWRNLPKKDSFSSGKQSWQAPKRIRCNDASILVHMSQTRSLTALALRPLFLLGKSQKGEEQCTGITSVEKSPKMSHFLSSRKIEMKSQNWPKNQFCTNSKYCDLFKIFVHCEVARKIERRGSLG